MNLMMAVFFIIPHQLSASDYMYSELEHLGGSCFPRDSCVPPRPEDQDHLWGNYTCECGVHCIRYGTCCANSPHYGEMLKVEYRGEVCLKISTAFPQSVLAVSRCSDRWRSDYNIREKCEESVNIAEDPMSVVPVTSLATHVTYKNYFCAMCNYDNHDVYMWNLELQFDAKESVPSLSNITKDFLLENIVYNNDNRAWGIVADDDSFYKVKFKFRVPSSIQKFVKKCYINMVNRCSPDFFDDRRVQYMCASYYAPIRLQENGTNRFRKFRNIHCAMCNGVNLTQPDVNICKLDVDTRKTMFSLAHLLDINRSDGDIVGKKEACSDRHKWDPFFKKCRSLACAIPGHVIRDGICVQA